MMYSYKMPGLSNYRFNKYGGCRRINGTQNRQVKLITGGYKNGYYQALPPYYNLTNDNGYIEMVTLKEIQQYIKHIDLLRSKLTI